LPADEQAAEYEEQVHAAPTEMDKRQRTQNVSVIEVRSGVMAENKTDG
jgi:hypothetical protein